MHINFDYLLLLVGQYLQNLTLTLVVVKRKGVARMIEPLAIVCTLHLHAVEMSANETEIMVQKS